MENTNQNGERTIAEQLHAAVVALAARCDGAHSEDRVGFNKWDTAWGHQLAKEDPYNWSSGRCEKVRLMLRKYGRQLLDNHQIDLEAIPVAEPVRALNFEQDHGGQFVLTWEYADPQFRPIIAAVKAIERRYWKSGRRAWVVPADLATPVMQLAEQFGFKVSDAALEALEQKADARIILPTRNPSQLDAQGAVKFQAGSENKVLISFARYDADAVADLKRVFPHDRRWWNGQQKHWVIDLDGVNRQNQQLYTLVEPFAGRWNLIISDGVSRYLAGRYEPQGALQEALPSPEPAVTKEEPREEPVEAPAESSGDIEMGAGWSGADAAKLFG